MTTPELILEYLKVILTWPAVTAVVVLWCVKRFGSQIGDLLTRLATIRLPGGTELSIPQLPSAPEKKGAEVLPEVPKEDEPAAPDVGAPAEVVQQKLNAERARAYLWEYRYLNLFLVAKTQRVLEWFGTLTVATTPATYDTFWTTAIPEPAQRQTVLAVLESHYLVVSNDGLLTISEKGREYLEWRSKI
jgi:hypothetical protein